MSNESEESRQIIGRFWATMQTNDFKAVGELLHDDYVLEWPQSGERIRGRADFVAVNQNYPAQGRWEFTIYHILAEGDQVVSDVGVTDGEIKGRVITFSTVRDGKIFHQTEFWPDPFEPAAWRSQWVETMKSSRITGYMRLVIASLLGILQPADMAASVSYIVFPSTGCWAVVATKGPEQIQFITQFAEP